MRIIPISYAQPVNVRKINTTQKEQLVTPSFKSWQAGAAGTVGTGAGVLLGMVAAGSFGVASIISGMVGAFLGVLAGKASEGASNNGYHKNAFCGSNNKD